RRHRVLPAPAGRSGASSGTEEPSGFTGTAGPLPPDVREAMTGVSWRPDCPVELDDLMLLHVAHWGFDGHPHTGQLVVAASVADTVLNVFARVFAAGFPIERMELVDAYGGDDDRSMAANNTHAFNAVRSRGPTAGRSTPSAPRSTSTRSRTPTCAAVPWGDPGCVTMLQFCPDLPTVPRRRRRSRR
ncbi:MAG TPA: hypothetical protein VM287_15105, partial [Egibacteraceae bacterium]|nr:hypothetical protein [Egibacteraceae bacterium]